MPTVLLLATTNKACNFTKFITNHEVEMRFSAITCLAAWALSGMGCGGEGTYTPDPSKLPEDKVQPITYPAGPYGTSVGSVLEDLKFASALYDPSYLCKKGSEHRLADGKGPRAMSMGDMFRGSKWCSNKPVQLAWIALTTGW